MTPPILGDEQRGLDGPLGSAIHHTDHVRRPTLCPVCPAGGRAPRDSHKNDKETRSQKLEARSLVMSLLHTSNCVTAPGLCGGDIIGGRRNQPNRKWVRVRFRVRICELRELMIIVHGLLCSVGRGCRGCIDYARFFRVGAERARAAAAAGGGLCCTACEGRCLLEGPFRARDAERQCGAEFNGRRRPPAKVGGLHVTARQPGRAEHAHQGQAPQRLGHPVRALHLCHCRGRDARYAARHPPQ